MIEMTPEELRNYIQECEDKAERISYPVDVKARCPHCNTILETDDTYDFEYDYEGIDLRVVGHCPICGREYQWSEFAECVNWQVADLREV